MDLKVVNMSKLILAFVVLNLILTMVIIEGLANIEAKLHYKEALERLIGLNDRRLP